jgi:GNAT superfamily N-acetyltransferase
MATSYKHRTPAANRRSMKRVVDTAAAPPGVLAYVNGVPVGWCAVAPRDEYPRITRERVTAPVDDQPVWSVVCFSVLRSARRQGVSRALLSAAIELAADHGARIIEAYPVERTLNTYRGYTSVYRDTGFEAIVRRHPDRPIMRYRVRRKARKIAVVK